MQTQIQIDIDRLAIGMYVAELDRPWVETPFLFQGFRITEQSEVDTLRQLCRRVTVDVTLGDRPAETARKSPPPELEPETPNAVFRVAHRQPVNNRVLVDEELAQAQRVQVNLVRAMDEAMKGLRAGSTQPLESIRAVSASLVDSIERNPDALTWLTTLKSKDAGTYQHSIAVGILVLTVGRHLRLPRATLDAMALGGLLFDVGKTKVAEDILMKPDRLTEAEFKQFQHHVDYGIDMLRGGRGVTEAVLAMVRTHHERHNGSGYPAGLSGDSIPALGKIVGIADAYETMLNSATSGRRLSPHDVLRYFNTCRDELFDGALVEEFIQAVGIYPTGTLVRLSDNSVGVIYEQNRLRRLQPRVLVVLDTDGQRLKPFRKLDLQMHGSGADALQIVDCLEPGACGIDTDELFL